MTNFEKIKSMSIDDMSQSAIDFFACPYGTDYVGCEQSKKFNDDCIACTKYWLNQEAEE